MVIGEGKGEWPCFYFLDLGVGVNVHVTVISESDFKSHNFSVAHI